MKTGHRIALNLGIPNAFVLVVSVAAFSLQTDIHPGWWIAILVMGGSGLTLMSFRRITRTIDQQLEQLADTAARIAADDRLNADTVPGPKGFQRVVDQLERIDTYIKERTRLAREPDKQQAGGNEPGDALGKAILEHARCIGEVREELLLNRSLADLAPVMLAVSDPDGKVILANRYAAETQEILPGAELNLDRDSDQVRWNGNEYSVTREPVYGDRDRLLGYALFWKNPDPFIQLTGAVERLSETGAEPLLPDDYPVQFARLVTAVNAIVEANTARVEIMASQLSNATGIPRKTTAPEELPAIFNTHLAAMMEDARALKDLAIRVAGDDHAIIKAAEARATSVSELHASVTQLAAHHQLTGGTTAKTLEIVRLTRDTTNRGISEINRVHEAMDGITATARQITRAVKALRQTAEASANLARAIGEGEREQQDQKALDQAAREIRNLQAHAGKESENVERLLENVVLRMNQGGEHLSRAVSSCREIAGGVAGAGELLDGMVSESDMLARCLTELNRLLVSLDKTTANAAVEADSRIKTAGELINRAKRVAKGLSAYTQRPARLIASTSEAVPVTIEEETVQEEEPRRLDRRRKKRRVNIAKNDIIIENEHHLDDKEFGRY
jgi:methyl-accepting chemotaxis protein